MSGQCTVINVNEEISAWPVGSTQAININLRANHFVKFANWFPYYQGIRAEFGYSSEKDREAAQILSELIKKKKKSINDKVLQKKISRKNVIIVGAGTSLEDEKVL